MYLITYWKKYYKVIWLTFLFVQLMGIAFCTNVFALGNVSIKVQNENVKGEIYLTLNKKELSNFISIAPDEDILKVLEENEKKIENLKQELVEAEKGNEGKDKLTKLKQKIEKAEKAFRSSFNGKVSINIDLKAEYPGPIYLSKSKDDIVCKDVPPFFIYEQGFEDQKIHICKLRDLGNDIKANLIVKKSGIEVIKEKTKYKLLFDKAENIIIKFQGGELSGYADLQIDVNPQVDNPITFSETQAPAGKTFKIKIPTGDKNIVKKDDRLYVFFINGGIPNFPPSIPIGRKLKQEDTFYIFKPVVPEFLEGEVDVVAMIIDDNGKIKAFNNSKFYVQRQFWAIFYGGIITLLVIFLISLLRKGSWKIWWRAPLNFTETQLGRYSVSLLQILIWTAITLFSYIYVYCVKGEFIHITNQILILLGISGATALSAKATAMARFREIPEKYFIKNGENLKDNKRKPKFSDYISIGNIPNIFKFQILGFTVITGIIVIWELIKTSNFPEIPDGFLTLMGISGGVYVGNEMVSENSWKKLDDKVAEAEKKTGKEHDDLKDEIYKELDKILDSKKTKRD